MQLVFFSNSLMWMLFFGLLSSISGCQSPAPSSSSNALTPKNRAEQLMMEAWSEESKVTPLLESLESQYKIKLRGLVHRLKTHDSTVRKVRKILKENPQLKTHQVRISDTLRYTFEVGDEPKGNYVKVVSNVLKRLEHEGHKVIRVKNYWPKGDNYSGVNSILETSSKLQWELQFHTPESFQEQKRSHSLYERLRALDTPPAEKQSLFQKMTTPWETIPVPQNVLEERNLHLTEMIRKYPPPTQ